ncbi:MAG: hypothetical protein DMG97_26680, partial [Acidobacteria bacterium]
DSGATYTYVRSSLIQSVPRKSVARPAHVLLAGREIDIQELCFIDGKIEGLDFFTDAVPLDEIGQADGHKLDAIIGAATVEHWEIKLDPRRGELDLEGLRRRAQVGPVTQKNWGPNFSAPS